jgi:hypothetical protein
MKISFETNDEKIADLRQDKHGNLTVQAEDDQAKEFVESVLVRIVALNPALRLRTGESSPGKHTTFVKPTQRGTDDYLKALVDFWNKKVVGFEGNRVFAKFLK